MVRRRNHGRICRRVPDLELLRATLHGSEEAKVIDRISRLCVPLRISIHFRLYLIGSQTSSAQGGGGGVLTP